MACIAYDETAAAAFAATRTIPPEGLRGWRDAIARQLRPGPGTRVLDLGAGTGAWAELLTSWYGIEVIGVEPAPAMWARAAHRRMLAGDAAAIPLATASLDGAWLSTVVHHFPDLPAVAAELRRVLRPGAPVLIRSVFAERPAGLTLFRYFPEALRVLDSFPSVADVCAAFADAGFVPDELRSVPQLTARSLREAAEGLRREAHTPLMLISDAEYAQGLTRLRSAAQRRDGPVVDVLDLLVLR